MKKLSKKSVLLFAAAMALCAFAMPSMAGAVSFTVINSEHTLDSSNVGFGTDSGPLGVINSNCTASSFTGTVASAANAEITAASFGGTCTATGSTLGHCLVDATAVNLPWTVTALSSSDVQIHGIHVNVVFTQTTPDATCNLPGASVTITGTVTGAWNNTSHHLTLSNAPGLTGDNPLGNSVVTARGTFRDTQQTLTIDN
jgi:hypothetical protein